MVEQLASIDWNLVLTYGLKILGYAIGTVIVALASIIFAKLKTKIGESRLNSYIKSAVEAAEQMFPNLGKKTGKEKYDYVVAQVTAKFPKIANDEKLKTLIEAAVYSVSEQVKLIAKAKDQSKNKKQEETKTEESAPATPSVLSIG